MMILLNKSRRQRAKHASIRTSMNLWTINLRFLHTQTRTHTTNESIMMHDTMILETCKSSCFNFCRVLPRILLFEYFPRGHLSLVRRLLFVLPHIPCYMKQFVKKRKWIKNQRRRNIGVTPCHDNYNHSKKRRGLLWEGWRLRNKNTKQNKGDVDFLPTLASHWR